MLSRCILEYLYSNHILTNEAPLSTECPQSPYNGDIKIEHYNSYVNGDDRHVSPPGEAHRSPSPRESEHATKNDNNARVSEQLHLTFGVRYS